MPLDDIRSIVGAAMDMLNPSNEPILSLQIDGVIDELLPLETVIHESLSEVGYASVDFASDSKNLDLASLLGASGSLNLKGTQNNHGRDFHGVITEISQTGVDRGHGFYRLRLANRLELLSRRTNLRIFQQQSIIEITKSIFQEHNIEGDAIAFNLVNEYLPRDYCVQYRETDLAFVRRILAEEGVYWHVSHSDKAHIINFNDNLNAHQLLAQPEVSWRKPTGQLHDEAICHSLRFSSAITHHQSSITDYNFQKPALSLAQKLGETNDHYDYPGHYSTPDVGGRLAAIRLQAHEVEQQTVDGVATARNFTTGSLFDLYDHPAADANQQWLLNETLQFISQPQLLAEESSQKNSFEYRVEFRALPSATQYRANFIPKPRISGAQTAVVTGPEGEEIYVDEFARIKVQFHWDREGEHNENSSCWVRVGQSWAGGAFGQVAIPRIGQEVIVDFINGDPDQPLVTGSVYNGLQKTPYELPEHKTRTVFKTDTHQGEGSNEIYLEDKLNEQEVYLHAQKDYNHVAEHNYDAVTGNDRSEDVAHDQLEMVTNNRESTVGHDETKVVENDRIFTTAQDQLAQIHSIQETVIEKDLIEHVNNQRKETTYANHDDETGGDYEHMVHGKYVVEASDSISDKTKIYEVSASTKVEHIGPGGKLVIDSKGITIECKNLDFVAASIDFQSSGAGASIPMPQGQFNEGAPFDKLCAMRDDGSCPLEDCPCGKNKDGGGTEAVVVNIDEMPETAGISANVDATGPTQKPTITLEPGSKGSWNKELNGELQSDTYYQVADYRYETDASGRVTMVGGTLKYKKRDRNTYQQAKAGKEGGIKDGLKNDEGGHMVASIFDGPGEQINYSAMNGNLNKGVWKRMENQWAKALKKKPPQDVYVVIDAIYEGGNKRPVAFDVAYTIDDEMFEALMKNAPGGK